ncbi:Hypothetical predicted protein [Paramuricea clavata]|uniref:Retropepsins domain-containing protein n=1 Tax=Paramuricea clavata TaxID=317549 RepID=A0A7D9EYV1_PARCT|nr:Hypothetical predicted protein [Paramuricea clavata]
MANHGKLEEYDSQEEWSQYIEQLEFYFEANGVDDEDKQRAILLSVCGSKTYKLIRNLITPNKPSEKTFAELVELAIVQRFKFNTRFTKPGESIASYVAELRSLSEHCDFKLEEMLRGRLVCGINDEQIQRRLLAESSLDFKKAMKIATSMETAVKNARYLTHQMANANINTEKSATLHSVDNQGQGNQLWSKPECGRCGGKHDPQQCKFRDADDEIEEEDDNYGIYSLGKGQAEPYVVDVLVSNESLKMEVDTGAAVSVMNEDTYTLLKKKHPNLELKESKVRLNTYTGEQVKVLGQLETSVKYDDQEGVWPLLVITGKGPNLIGRNWLQKIKINWENLFQLKEDKNTSVKVNKLLEKYEKVFHEELETFSGPKAKIYVAEDASPKYYKARPVPYALREKVEKELERLQEVGTIEPVQFADWAAPIVPIVKDDKSIRICGDYKVTVNQATKLDNYPIPKAEDLFATLSGGEKFIKLDMSQA